MVIFVILVILFDEYCQWPGTRKRRMSGQVVKMVRNSQSSDRGKLPVIALNTRPIFAVSLCLYVCALAAGEKRTALLVNSLWDNHQVDLSSGRPDGKVGH